MFVATCGNMFSGVVVPSRCEVAWDRLYGMQLSFCFIHDTFTCMAESQWRKPVGVCSTGGVADYVRSLLKVFEEQQYFIFGNLLGITSGMTWQQVR